ncbi:hypothetical protein J6590_018361 [Homalodisca vitripennis]|nr:hypothetical protein J6590_018361 [Homalodisca vitripennis]
MCGCVSERAGSKRINTFPMKDMNSGRVPLSMDRKQDAPHAGLRKCLLVILVLGVVAIATFLILLVVFAPFERSWAQFQESLKSITFSSHDDSYKKFLTEAQGEESGQRNCKRAIKTLSQDGCMGYSPTEELTLESKV